MSSENTTLLIVEDDDVDVELVTRGLRKRNLEFNVHTRTDGGQALNFLRETISNEQRNQLIVLLDLNMPRMNGHEFLSELRNDPTLQKTIVFVLTTSSLEADCAKAYERNVAGYFVKSNLNGLLDLLGTYCQYVKFPDLSATT